MNANDLMARVADYNTFEKRYDQAVAERSVEYKEKGHGDIQPAFIGDDKRFTTDNWNDPLISFFRNDLFEALLDGGELISNPSEEVRGNVYFEDDQTSMVLAGELTIVLSWYKRRGRTEQCYHISDPSQPLTLEDIYDHLTTNDYLLTNDSPAIAAELSEQENKDREKDLIRRTMLQNDCPDDQIDQHLFKITTILEWDYESKHDKFRSFWDYLCSYDADCFIDTYVEENISDENE